MKKAAVLLVALVICVSLCACGSSTEVESSIVVVPAPTEKPTPSPTVEPTPAPVASLPIIYDPEKTVSEDLDKVIVEQGNRHGMNLFCFDNSWIYGAWAGEKYSGEVVKVRYDNSDWTVIDSDTQANIALCHAVKGGYLYYSEQCAEGTELVKVRSSGEDAKVIISNHQGSIQLVENFIYYTTSEYWNDDNTAVTENSSHLYRCDINGENVEAVLEKPVYYFTVFGDYVLYQDDKDDVTLHVYNMLTGEDKRLNNLRSFWPIYDGDHIYYLSDSTSEEDGQYKLWCLSRDGSENTEIDLGCHLGGILLRGNYIYYINVDDSNRVYRCLKDGTEIELITQDSSIYAFQWVNDCLAYMTRDEEGYISGIYLCDADGADRIEFCKSDDYWYLG